MAEARISPELRRHIVMYANECCEYCWSQARYATQSFSIEHIVPRSRGGSATADNLALACQGCNNHKYDKESALDPATGKLVTLYHPRRDIWEDHFVWNDDFTLIIGLTSSG